MATHTKWFYTLLAPPIVLICAHRADGGDLDRVRSESMLMRTVIATALDHSVTFRSLLERIEQSDVIVYVMCHRFDSGTLSGRTALATALPGVRYVRVHVRCQQSEQILVTIVAHELQHVVEIALSAWVVNEPTFRRLFSAIGVQTCLLPNRAQFETVAAIETGNRVRAEYRLQLKIAKRANHDAGRRARRSDRTPTGILVAK